MNYLSKLLNIHRGKFVLVGEKFEFDQSIISPSKNLSKKDGYRLENLANVIMLSSFYLKF